MGIAAGVFVVLIIVLVVAAKFLITPERVRQTVIPIAEKNLNRSVAIGDIDISLFSGVVIRDVRVGMQNADQDFVAADEMVLRYQLWPLLKKQVVVDEIRLEKPQIRVVRNKDGTFNFSDLLAGASEPEAGGAKPAPDAEGGGSGNGGAGINLLVSRMQVKDGTVFFTDQAAGTDGFEYEISGFNASAKDISPDQSFPFEMTARPGQAPFSAKGTVNAADAQIQADVKLADFNLVDFLPYFEKQVPGRISRAQFGMDVSVDASPRSVEASGNLSVREMDMVLDARKDSPINDAHLALDYDLTADLSAKSIEVRRADLDANNIRLTASGRVKNFDTAPSLDMVATLPSTKMETILAAVPKGLVPGAAEMNPAGEIRARAELAGPADNAKALLKTGNLDLNQLQASIEGLRPVVTGTIDLSSQKIQTKGLEVVLGDDVVSVDFAVTDFFSTPVNIQNRIHASNLNIDELLAALQTSQPGQKEKKGRAKPDSSDSSKPAPGGKNAPLGPFDLPVSANGQIEVDKAVYKGLAMTDLKLSYRLIENVLTVETLKAKLAEGQMTGNARVDLGVAGLSYNSDFSVQEISADALVSGLYPKAAGLLLGRTSAAINVSGRGTAWEQMRDALSGQGGIRIFDGKITGNDFAGGLARALGTGNLKSIDFKSFEGDFEIDDGKIRLDSDFAGNEVKMKPAGTIGLNGDLDLNLNLAVAPGFSSRLSSDSLAGQLLADEQGWTGMPVALGGSLEKPRFVLDKARLQKQLTEKGTQKVIEKGLQKLFQ